MRKRIASRVEYHPEFLYFNEMVRRSGYRPADNPSIWTSDDKTGLSPYDVCNWVLENIVLSKGAKPVGPLMQELSRLGHLKSIRMDIDVQPWFDFAYSLDFEQMVDRYSKVIFDCFGTTFELPPVKVSPVRLRPANPEAFDRLLENRYVTKHILRTDPACYHPGKHYVFMPIPEHKTRLQPYLYDELVIHEFLHAPLRALSGRSLHFEEGTIAAEPPPGAWVFSAFGELFANIGSVAVLRKSGALSKSDLLAVSKTVVRDRAVSSCGIAQVATGAMLKIPFKQLCEILSPVFDVYKRLAFLFRERVNIGSASEKKLKGILRKKYAYKKGSIRGRSKKRLLQEVRHRSFSRFRALARRVEELSLEQVLRRAHINETDDEKKFALMTLVAAFGEDMKDDWEPLLSMWE